MLSASLTTYNTPAFFLFPLSLPLRVHRGREWPGRSRALPGGAAGRRWRRRGAGVVCRCRSSCFGVLPVVWSGASGSPGQIPSSSSRGCAGFLPRRLVRTVVSSTSRISANKACFCFLSIRFVVLLLVLLLAGRGGEGDEKGSLTTARSRGGSSGARLRSCSSGRPWWRGEGSVVVGILLLVLLVVVVFVDSAAPAGLGGEGGGGCRCWCAGGGGSWRWRDGWVLGGGGRRRCGQALSASSDPGAGGGWLLRPFYKVWWCCLLAGAWYGVAAVVSKLWARSRI